MKTLRIAVPVPLRQLFDYLPQGEMPDLKPGMRVKIPFQSRELIGIFMGENDEASSYKLKPIIEFIDESPILSEDILKICEWAADYYHYPIGEVLEHAMPNLLRQGKNAELSFQRKRGVIPLSDTSEMDSRVCEDNNSGNENIDLSGNDIHLSSPRKRRSIPLSDNNEMDSSLRGNNSDRVNDHYVNAKQLLLNSEQQLALDSILASQNNFQTFLLNGVTGSGKTEVYLQAIAAFLKDQKQILVLVPEIGLTPQTIQRFKERFSVSIVALHSSLREKEKLNAWVSARNGDAKIIIGTRSAIFTPFKNLGLIIVDEEHDLSFKQQEGFRYHARDLAILRAHFQNIPIVLGSATPSLETLQKANSGRYQHLRLLQRAGNASLPSFQIIDIRKLNLEEGLSPALISSMHMHLAANNQVMLFLNRRGFSPVLMCHACGWMGLCKRCDARLTYHQKPAHLHCHHCDSRKPIPSQCETCQDKNLIAVGLGTERLEQALEKHFPTFSIARIDRDNTRKKGHMEKLLDEIQEGKHKILIGTQMLAKGHHFPNVTLVAIIDADGGFFSSDFRALERTGQLVLQVSGRAGRVEKKGEVIIQTHHPDHPLLHQLINYNYQTFAETILEERNAALLPPFSFFALFRAEAHGFDTADIFLNEIKNIAKNLSTHIHLLGPIAAPMAKRAGKFRAQLLLQATQRPLLQNFLKNLIPEIEKLPSKKRVKWSLDVDPVEMI